MLTSGIYYFIVVVKNKQINVSINNCRETGEEYRKTEIEENQKLSFFAPKYTYNKKLSACIYSGGFMDAGISENNITKYIKNLNTNEEIIGSSYIGNQKMFGVSNLEFNEKERELFLKN